MADTGSDVDLSFIIPCHNERGNVRALADAIAAAFDDSSATCELVFVDDGSMDGTADALRDLVEERKREGGMRTRCLSFSRNFGKESAMYAGLEAAVGTCCCLIDADLQQDPAIARTMYDYLVDHPEYEVVAAYQDRRAKNGLSSRLAGSFYRFFNAASDDIQIPPDMSDFRVFRSCVRDALLSLRERDRFTKGLFAWVGFNTYAMPYVPAERHSGTTNWSFQKLLRYAITGLFAFSTWPLRALRTLGIAASICSALYLLYVIIVDYFIFGIDIPGYPTIICLILLFGGLQLFAIGLIGDYVARNYIESKHRPLYIVKETIE